jgi:hypothetical protein
VLDHAGLGEVADRFFELVQEGKRSEARKLVETDVIDHIGVVVGDEFEAALERWGPLVDRITFGVPWYGMDAAAQLEHFRRLLAWPRA